MALIGVHVERPVRPGALVRGDGMTMVLHFTCQSALWREVESKESTLPPKFTTCAHHMMGTSTSRMF